MFKTVRNVKINYKQYGHGEDLVLLHGWGQNIQMMEPLGDLLKDKFKITIVDLPGFGLSEEPTSNFTLYDYVDLLEELFLFLEIKNPILIGHSFGGRLSIIYSAKNKVNKLILFGAPCVRHKPQTKKSFKQKTFDFIKKFKIFRPIVEEMKKHIGSLDYRNATPVMRDILVRTVNEDLSEYAKKIKCPVLMIWGDKDTAAPVEHAKELDEMLSNSKFIILPGTHYCYLENLQEVYNCIINFL